ncbi:PP2C family protein-serine/threonine phosphatase [Streptomyces sp. NPDC048179]|uniref:PP2C family protein-serine/threonine phosphatase n=1 Tax=Streptomyces sp. NPDC048179 TaxID=3365506 RepID=UPI00371DEFBD
MGPGEVPEGGSAVARSLARFLPALLIAAGVCYDFLTPVAFTAVPFFTAAPLIAAPLSALRTTALTGVAALLATYAVHARFGFFPDADALTEILTVAVLAVGINRIVRIGDQRLASAREIAEAAQEGAFIGGDLYAVQDTPYGVRLVVGDVRGKGMGAVAAVAVVIGAFREAAEQEATLEAVAGRLERALVREGARRGGVEADEGFATAVLAELPHGGGDGGDSSGSGSGDGNGDGNGNGNGDGTVRIVNRGHPPPLLLHGDGRVSAVRAPEAALPLGMGELGAWPDRAAEHAFPGGATLLLYTDGLVEARDAHGRFYDPERRLAGRTFAAPGALLARLAAEVRRRTGGGMTDDMALLAVRRP